MKGFKRRRKQPVSRRTPRIERQKQSIFQYSSNRSQSERDQRGENPEERAESTTGSLKKYLYRLGFLAILAGLAAISFLGGKPQIAVAGEHKLRDVTSYQAVVEKAVGGWRGYSKLTLDRKKAADEIRSAYPEIVTVDVTTPFFGRSPVVKLELARPSVILSNGPNKYALDQRGLALFNLRRSPLGRLTL
jgi:hypothetical protein